MGRFERVCDRALDERGLRAALLEELRTTVPFEWFAWVATDPATGVGVAPLAAVPDLTTLPALIRARYQTDRWTERAAGEVRTWSDRSASSDWHVIVRGWGVTDVASTVSADSAGTWGFVDLWRAGGSFDADECAQIAAMVEVATPALRDRLAGGFEPVGGSPVGGDPAVLILGPDLTTWTLTGAADATLRALLPTEADGVPVPAVALNVAAQLLAVEAGVDSAPATARAYAGDGRWVTARAARLLGEGAGGSITVTIEPTGPADRADLFARVIGLSRRERDVLDRLVAGDSTRDAATALFVSEHTIQDHLKSVFAKAGVRSRRELVARATGAGV